ncbi:NADH-dependent flavin oxidoreductase [Enterococcus sp. DIV0876]|uniref:NADH-dependent flavin oxidoreductase n=1 Tax=Enterococcus sp. DIV0876 TaxID=2774633 RepID=UPI003D2FDB0A
MNKAYTKLFEPFTFKSGVTIANRVMMAPMTTDSAFQNGMVTTDERNYYARRAEGVGALITACAHVSEDGKFAGSFSISSDQYIDGMAKLAKAIQARGTKAILQIFHVGRMAPTSWLRGMQPVSASAIAAERAGAVVPRELSTEEIEDLVHAFGEATRRAIEAGFDGVEIHGANTYLIQQFFSPHSNRRTDRWGGSLEKRMTFPLAVIQSVTQAVKEHATKPFLVGYRISPEEIETPGITIEDTLALLEEIKKTNIDYVHVSLGDVYQGSLRNKEQSLPTIARIQSAIGSEMPIVGVGQIVTPERAVSALEELEIPLVAIGRELIIEPDWVKKVQSDQIDTIRTEIDPEDREELAIPDAMWAYITDRPGWLPIKEA